MRHSRKKQPAAFVHPGVETLTKRCKGCGRFLSPMLVAAGYCVDEDGDYLCDYQVYKCTRCGGDTSCWRSVRCHQGRMNGHKGHPVVKVAKEGFARLREIAIYPIPEPVKKPMLKVLRGGRK